MRKLKVGNIITASLFGGEKVTGKVLNIEICKDGAKFGRPVKSCDIDKHNGTIDIDCGNWCYFTQVKSIK